jgi:hypothetical protein
MRSGYELGASLIILACYFSCTAGNTQCGCVTVCSACGLTVCLSLYFKVATPHPSRLITRHPTNPHCTVRANYGEDKDTLKHIQMTPPLEKITLAKNIVHYEKTSSCSSGKEKHASTRMHTRICADVQRETTFERNKYTHTHIYIYIYVYIHTYIHTYIHICTHMHYCMNIFPFTYGYLTLH